MANKSVSSLLRAAREAPATPPTLKVFCSYAHADEKHKNQLIKQLAALRRAGRITIWQDRAITPGLDFANAIDQNLAASDIVLLLISSDFIDSDFCYCVEMKMAVERHERGSARVIPIIVRPCDWQHAPFGHLNALPKNGKPVTTWHPRDQAYLDIAKGVRSAIDELTGSEMQDRKPPRAASLVELVRRKSR